MLKSSFEKWKQNFPGSEVEVDLGNVIVWTDNLDAHLAQKRFLENHDLKVETGTLDNQYFCRFPDL